jgi:apolipoprotein N-acyltransferase
VVNALLFAALRAGVTRGGTRQIAAALAVMGFLGAFGAWRVERFPAAEQALRAAVVQGNIPQEQKWDEAYKRVIVERYTHLTAAAIAAGPDILIWPETSVPGYLGIDEDLTQWVMGLARQAGRPLLVGTPMVLIPSFDMVNRAVFVDGAGNLGAVYDKMHLVPFGEFVPFERQVRWLRQVLPPIGTFIPGKRPTVFDGPHSSRFGVLICFEDLFPDIARRYARLGARWLVVITNDAWFGNSAAAYQHAQASTLRAVEQRMPVVRAANTGWSGCIDAAGRWTGSVSDGSGKELFVEGMHLCGVRPGAGLTFYARTGDWFVLACGALSLTAFAWVLGFRNRGSKRL